ncbi:hypothetical protein [Lentzea aerocolonigenes]|uniref:hypothetical protein n=1 Tax=Lentzea aerocolonigenes TaxID=68170 RepID=UPI0006918498|nr:hypothetical protein [Lentzea aerocolonigenes]MCP2246499.1 hypothetical protein [Lentzea aerocolonigenes]
MKRNSLPDPHSRAEVLRARRKYTERVVFALIFTVVELWAIVAVVVLFDGGGVLAVAVSIVLSAALIALWDTWRTLLMFGRALRAWLPETLPAAEEAVEPERPPSSLLRL